MRQLIAATMAALIVTLVVNLWVSFGPVVAFMRATDWQKTSQNTITAKITGYKWNECDFVTGSAVGWEKIGNEWQETPFFFIDDTSPDSTRPAHYERQSFGRWSWFVTDDADLVRTTVQHECSGSDDVRTTIIGPFRYKP